MPPRQVWLRRILPRSFHTATPGHPLESIMLDPAPQPTDALFDAVYARLKAMAGRQLARRGQETLETTALVHELYLRMTTGRELAFEHPAQFFTYAARAMRHLLADRARD